MQLEMDSFLKREMGPGEELLWFNHPNTKRLRRMGPNSVFLILSIIFGSIGLPLVIVAATLLATLHNTNGTTIATVFFIVGGTFLFMTLIFFILTFAYRHPRQTLYGITNQRVMILNTGPILIVDSYSRNDIGHITRREQPDGSGDLFFTSPRSPMYQYNYNYAYNNSSYAYGYSSYGMGNTGRFIGIPDVRTAEQILRETFKLDR